MRLAYLLLCALGWSVTTVTAQNYTLEHSVIAGGGDTSAGGQYVVSGTIGQVVAGEVSGGSYHIDVGFWSTIFPARTEPLAPPTDLQALVSRKGALLSWSDSAEPVTYRLQAGTTPGGTDLLAAHYLPAFDETAISTLLTNLNLGNTYYWSVQAIDLDLNPSAFADFVSFTTDYGYARSLGLERAANRTVKVSVAKLLAMVDDEDLDETLSLLGVEETTANGATVYVDGNWVIYQPAEGYNDTDTFTFQVSDSRGAIAQGTVTVVIREEDNGQTRNLISVTVQTGGAMQIQAIGLPGRSYTIQATTNLTTPVWVTLGTRDAGANGLFEFEDADALNHTQRYYRAIPTP